MKKIILKALVPILSLIIFASCGEYQKAKNSKDPEFKLKKAKEYFEKKKYSKAEYLLNDIIPYYRGTTYSEEVSYLYVMSLYHQEIWELAAYYFDLFTNTFPASEKLEECSFLGPYCYFMDSPDPRLDQESTEKAMSGFINFINTFPESKRVADANDYIDKCRDKLTKKSYLSARLYFDLERYNSAVIALNNSLKKYPDSDYREKLKYLLVKSNFFYAEKSVPEKQKERYELAQETCNDYLEEFEKSEKDAKNVLSVKEHKKKIQEKLNKK